MKKSITVIHIITKLELGGAQKVCLSLCKELPSMGIETVLISGQQGPLVPQAHLLKKAILLPSLQREISLKNSVHELKNFFSLVTHLKKLKKQYPNIIVHTHSTKAGVVGRWAAFFAGIKTRVHTVHGFAFHAHQKWLHWASIYLVELVTSFITSHFVCVAHHDARVGIKLFPFFKKKYHVIRAAVEWQIFYDQVRKVRNDFPVAETSFVFGTISCFKEQKNIFDLLRAFAHVHQTNSFTRLEIIGDGHLRAAIETWITTHKLEHAVVLHGWQKNVAPIMRQWHTFVLSSLWEGLPCAVVEARLLGMPVISYDTGGVNEVISHGKNGFLIPQKQWRTLAESMLLLAHNKQQYLKFKRYPDSLEEFKISAMTHQHSVLYKKMLNT